jgi:very-short-patch-repair endonuclease
MAAWESHSGAVDGLTSSVVLDRSVWHPDPVSPRTQVPDALRRGPFTTAQARAVGVTRGTLRGRSYCRLGAGLYRWAGLRDSSFLKLNAVACRLPAGAAFSGLSAAWLHGLDVTPDDPIDITIPGQIGSGRRVGAVVHRAALARDEIVWRRGLPTTSELRTVLDLAARSPLTEGVVSADLFLHARLVTVAELDGYVADHRGAKGVARLRRVVEMVEPKAESAMETRLRLLLVLAGLPRPEAQAPLVDDRGRFVARPDLFYRGQRLAIEFDGGNHRDRLVDDNRRQNRIVDAGFRLLRFTAADLYGAPDEVVLRVRDCLQRWRS